MKIFTNQDKRSLIDKEIDEVIEEMRLEPASSAEYSQMAANLELLMKARSYNKDQTKVSKDTKWTVLGSLAGVLIMIGFEQGHVITSKALGFIIKGRV